MVGGEMNNEPVAWIIDVKMTDCDDNFIWNTGNYPDWQVKDWIPLYIHPVKDNFEEGYRAGYKFCAELYEASPVKEQSNPVAWRSQSPDGYWSIYQAPVKGAEPLYTGFRELTDEQILCLWDWWSGEDLATNVLDFADTYRRALLGEAGLVKWHQAYVKKMNEQDPAWKATEQYKCNGFCGEYECRENKSKCKRKATQE